VNLAESITKNFEASADSCEASFYALRAFYGLSFAPKLQRVGTIHLSGSDQPTPDPSFSPGFLESCICMLSMLHQGEVVL